MTAQAALAAAGRTVLAVPPRQTTARHQERRTPTSVLASKWLLPVAYFGLAMLLAALALAAVKTVESCSAAPAS